MRLWSIHPQYLDTRGLVALWREALLAQNVLMGETRGYKNHPQLDRFRGHHTPAKAIASYLTEIWIESRRRNFIFDRTKILDSGGAETITVTRGQMEYEFLWLCHKLKKRNPARYEDLLKHETLTAHPLFIVINGDVEPWEKKRKIEQP